MTMRILAAVALAATFALVAPVRADEESMTDAQREVVKPIKLLINAIRYSKDDLASATLAHEDMAKDLLRDSWAKLSDAEKKEFVDGLALLFRRLSFPKAREIFEHLDAIVYEPPKVEGERARVKSTVVIHRDSKKEEISIEYVLIRRGEKWQIFDVVSEGEGTLEGIRTDQVEPLIEDGGTKLLMEKLRAKVAEVEKDAAAKASSPAPAPK